MKTKELIKLFHQAENYFMNAISEETLVIEDGIKAYLTNLPTPHFNPVAIFKTPQDITKVLITAKEFYLAKNLDFSLIIPSYLNHDFLSKELANNYFLESSQGIAMFLSLNEHEFSINDDLKVKILLNNKKLEDWLIPQQAFSSSNLDLCIEYAKLHKKALDKGTNYFHYSLYFNNQPISSITLSTHNFIARIDDLATLPDFQKKGFAGILLKYALLQAKKMSSLYCFLESSIEGLSLYKKFGFKSLYCNHFFTRKDCT